MTPEDSGAAPSVARAAAAILRHGMDDPAVAGEVDEILEDEPELTPALVTELREADPRRLPAVLRLVELLRSAEVLDVVAEVAFENPADLEAKRRALGAYRACDRLPPPGIEERLDQACAFADSPGSADPQVLEEVVAWPDVWRLPALSAWLDNADERALPLVPSILGQEAAVDLLVLDWLGDLEDSMAAEIAAARAESADDRKVAKAAKRTLHRLRSRGIAVREPGRDRTVGFSLAVEGEGVGESRAWWTSHDGSGARIIWVLWPTASGGRRMLQAVVGHEGIEKAEVTAATRKEFRGYLERLQQDPSLLVARVDPGRAAAALARAAERSEGRGEELPEGYREWYEAAGAIRAEAKSPDDADRPWIYDQVSDDEVHADSGLIEQAVDLLGEPFLRSWAVQGEVVERAAKRILRAKESELLVNEEQREEQVREALRSAVAEAFDDETRKSYRRRLEEMAGMLWTQGRRDAARRLLAAAVGLTEVGDLFARHAFARALVQRGVWLAYNEHRESERTTESRIVRPR